MSLAGDWYMMSPMKITHGYEGLGEAYRQARKGIPRFTSFMATKAGFKGINAGVPINIVELGAGSGQQTEFLEQELAARDITRYTVHAYDKSLRADASGNPGQLDVLQRRIASGEISERVIPLKLDFDGTPLPEETGSIHLVYMAHVFHHLEDKRHVLGEIDRILRRGGRFFNLGVALEHLQGHPLDEFFPTKYDYEVERYPTLQQYRKLFKSAGLAWQRPYRVGKIQERLIDRAFLTAVENTTIDSALAMMRDDDPEAFKAGVEKVRREVERGERAGIFRTYFTDIGRVFWGIKP